jgi:hypothetical protein
MFLGRVVLRGVLTLRRVRRRATLFSTLMKTWFEAAQFGADSQSVIAMRLMKIASGGPGATTEAHRMVSEKVAAFTEAQGVMMAALMTGKSLETAAAKAYAPYRRAVRANRRRLGA